jgi:VWFA-related protein
MKSVMSGVIFVLACGLTLAAYQSQTPAPQAPSVFRTRVEVFHLDVSVLDSNRQPVKGLTAADFTVIEDGKRQRVVAIAPIDIPNGDAPTATWVRDVAPDVATNAMGNRRLFIIVMDDAMVPPSQEAIVNAKRVGKDVVDRLGPDDLAAVVFTRDNRNTQDFTHDHARLLAAIDHMSGGFAGMQGETGAYYEQSSLSAVAQAAELLINVQDRRKALVYITPGVAIPMADMAPLQVTGTRGPSMAARGNATDMQNKLMDIFREASLANVNVYTYDVCGLRTRGATNDPCAFVFDGAGFLQGVADGTGGHATINTNDFTAGVTQMFEENSSYYILGYESTSTKGSDTYRRIEVQVNRPDVQVVYRSKYYAQPANEVKTVSKPVSPLSKALSGVVPNPDIPLRVSVTPLAVPGKPGQSTVAVVAEVERPAAVSLASGAPRSRMETMDLLVSAFDPEGHAKGSQKNTVNARRFATADGTVRYEMLARMDLKPGRYELRLATHDAARGLSGSVYADVEIPEFSKVPLSLSGLMLHAAPALTSGPAGALQALLPFVPTAVRDFAKTDKVTAFMRAYQGGDRPPLPMQVTIRVRSDHDVLVADSTQTMSPEKFGTGRAADVKFAVPIDRLPPGGYLLSIETRIDDRKHPDKAVARRDVRFTVR